MRLDQLEIPTFDGPEHNDSLASLIGTPGQIGFANSIRPAMLKRFAKELPSNVMAALRSITDSTWWIANQRATKAEEINWPKTWKAKPQ
jgi:hypothetical protein